MNTWKKTCLADWVTKAMHLRCVLTQQTSLLVSYILDNSWLFSLWCIWTCTPVSTNDAFLLEIAYLLSNSAKWKTLLVTSNEKFSTCVCLYICKISKNSQLNCLLLWHWISSAFILPFTCITYLMIFRLFLQFCKPLFQSLTRYTLHLILVHVHVCIYSWDQIYGRSTITVKLQWWWI